MGKTEWAMWANEQGVITSFVLIVGGLVGTASQFDKWEFGTYTLALGFLVLMVEYPRGKRKQGKKTVERGGQKCLTKFVNFLGVFGRNYWVRFVFYLLAAVPSFFFLATILGGACLVFTSLIYFRAALSGETWTPLLSDERPDSSSNKPSEPPKLPPPRGPRSRGQDNMACELEQPETCRV